VMVDTDALLAEVNPLAITEEGRAIAADAKFDLDDAAIYRHPEFAAFGARVHNRSDRSLRSGEEPHLRAARG